MSPGLMPSSCRLFDLIDRASPYATAFIELLSSLVSAAGGRPNIRRYSRENCCTLSYPTASAALEADMPSTVIGESPGRFGQPAASSASHALAAHSVPAMPPDGRVGVADDVGPMIVSLLTDDNRWINAQRIEVSGGQGI